MNFRKLCVGLSAAVGVAFAAAAGGAAAQPVVPSEAYARLPEVTSVQISPDGTKLAMLAGQERDEMVVLVQPLEGGQPTAIDASSNDIDDLLALNVTWLSDRYLLIVYRERVRIPGGSTDDADVGRLVIWDLEEGDYNEFAPNASIEAILPDRPNKVLVSASIQEFADSSSSFAASRGRADGVISRVNLYEYDLDRNDYRRIAEGTPFTVNWILGEDGRPIARQDNDFENRRWRVFTINGGRSRMVYEENYELERFGRSGRRQISDIGGLVAEDVNGRGVWFVQRENRDKLRGWLFNTETGEIQGPAIAPEGFDIGGFITDWRTGKVIGASWIAERRGVEWFDGEFASIQEQLDGLFPDSDVSISDWDRSGDRMIIAVNGGLTTTDYYLLDRAGGELQFLQTAYPEVPQERVHPVSIVDYQARDGLDLWGYLTLPNDRPAENLPLVIAPHGGPQARDIYGFDPIFAQPYADMGYAVFQPHFRGSDGTGLEFVQRGHGEWGRMMQSDITDAVLHLVDMGLVDPDRVCIWGWSYGGYAALAGYALTPEVYRCAIAGAPVSDILDMMAWVADQPGGVGSVNYWTEYIGDWRTDRDQMIAISPARQVANADDPLLLIHGAEDQIVPIEQAEIMRDAVQAAGKPVEYVRIEGDGHNLLFRRTRLTTIEAVREFLLEHNPPDPRPE